MGSSNFKDPVGVVLRMLRSSNPAARSALLHELARVALTPLDRVAGFFERRRLVGSTSHDAPALFIVGAPRSGTSLVQQLLAYNLDASYIPNGAGLLPHAPLLGARLFGRGGRDAPPSMQSFLGQTRTLRGPNDGFFLWDRWLGPQRGQLAPTIDSEQRAAMRHTINVWMERFGDPLINKNNRNSLCMSSIADAMPLARFLVVRRDPCDVALSLLKARKEVQGDARLGWGLLAEDAPPGSSEDEILQAICSQLVAIEGRMRHDVQSLGSERVMTVDLRDVCSSPRAVLESICHWMPTLKPRQGRLARLEPIPLQHYADSSQKRLSLLRTCLAGITGGQGMRDVGEQSAVHPAPSSDA